MTRDETIAAILAAHGVEAVAEGVYAVTGKPYRIRFAGRSDDGFACLWECDCPAGKHGRTCKHIAAVAAANNAVCDELGLE